MSCEHEHVKQLSDVIARTDWTRQPDGRYLPDPTGDVCLTKVISEETISWACLDCGADIDISEGEDADEATVLAP